MIVIGIDPGLYGGISCLDDKGIAVFGEDLTAITDMSTKWVDTLLIDHLVRPLIAAAEGNVVAYIERVGPMNTWGASTSFTFGTALGSLLGYFRGAGVRINLVSAQTWRPAVGVKLAPMDKLPSTATKKERDKQKADRKNANKKASMAKARLLFPGVPLTVDKDHGIAEAMLIAHYGWNIEKHGPACWAKPKAQKVLL